MAPAEAGPISPEERERRKAKIEELLAIFDELDQETGQKDHALSERAAMMPEEEREPFHETLERIRADKREAKRRFLSRFRGAASAAFVLMAGGINAEHHEPKDIGTGSYAERTVAAEELAQKGITKFQAGAYIPQLSEILARGIRPYSYEPIPGADVIDAGIGVVAGVFTDVNAGPDKMPHTDEAGIKKLDLRTQVEVKKYMHGLFEERMDAWRMYLGLPQQHGTFGISEYKPQQGHEDRYYYRLNHFLDNIQERYSIGGKKDVRPVKILVDVIEKEKGRTSVETEDITSGVMGHYHLAEGQDAHGKYISYYDRWDLDRSSEGKNGVVGKPYEIYDRIYYDPATYQPTEQPKEP